WRDRLARAGGAIGVRVLTFEQLYAACLDAAGRSAVLIPEPVQYRLLALLAGRQPLEFYAPLVGRPGFISVLQELIAELKAARIGSAAFSAAVAGLAAGPRLAELAQLYAAYQEQLRSLGWSDYAGQGWLAIEALEAAPAACCGWPLLIVDGFDNFTAAQLELLRLLAGQVGECLLTLTGDPAGGARAAHGRFAKTRVALESALGVAAEPLPLAPQPAVAALAHLEAGLFEADAPRLPGAPAVELFELPDRAAEARAGLRWLKERIVRDGCRPGQVALLARDLLPYRPFLSEAAAEFGLPLRLFEGLPLRANPAVAALLNLLRLALPAGAGRPGFSLPRRGVVETWRSPYFDWANGLGITPADADALDTAARWGRVIGGQSQWEELFAALSRASAGAGEDDEWRRPANLPLGPAAAALEGRFRAFLARIRPPDGPQTKRAYVAWLERLIGPDPAGQEADPAEGDSLGLIARVRAEPETAERDVAALQALKDVLRGLVWAEDELDPDTAGDYPAFLAALAAGLEAASFQPPPPAGREELLAANVFQARGLAFQAVALLGLAEGEFPAVLQEDPFLTDADRAGLRQAHGLALEPSLESAERDYFYDALTRPRRRLLLTRPRLSDVGAEWLPSPFWEEVRRLLQVAPAQMGSEARPRPEQAASTVELVESLAAGARSRLARAWLAANEGRRWTAAQRAGRLFSDRYAWADGEHDGRLEKQAAVFRALFAADYRWSASRLEEYRRCGFAFFVGRLLRLQPRQEPAERLDRGQLGSLVHAILEAVYRKAAAAGRFEAADLLAALRPAAEPLLDAAPRRLGFRPSAYWRHRREEILAALEHSLRALAGLDGAFRPLAFELRFQGAQVAGPAGNVFLLDGKIDRLDRDAAGRLRLIDYKTSGPWGYDAEAHARGEHVQLPLYALAAGQSPGLGRPAAGFYWHVYQAEASPFSLEAGGDPQAAIAQAAAHAWE
ncbi:MAG: PD-(D/E)XK nuclease family protein, partial [Candidatus Promineifilaceae bacterium]